MTRVLDPKDGFMVGEKSAKSSFSRVIRRFSDITNNQLSKSANKDGNAKPFCSSAKEFVEQLQKENTALLKLLADRNKIIELSNHELQKLRFNWQKAHQQNWQLAQANSQMLAELNIAKEKLKNERHEHGCLTAMLKAKNSELEAKADKVSQQINSYAIPKKGPDQSEGLTEGPKANIPQNHNRRRHSEYPSVGNSTVTQQDRVKGKTDNKRICLRRRSGTVKCEEPPEFKDLFEIEDAKFPSPTLDEDCYVSMDDSLSGGDQSANCDSNAASKTESKENEPGPKRDSRRSRQSQELLPRSSLGRPMRRAAEKINSYKEKPLNVKMRRSD